MPTQWPSQPLKIASASGAAVSVTTLPLAYRCEQVDPQLISLLALLTFPPALPGRVTVSVDCWSIATTVCATGVA